MVFCLGFRTSFLWLFILNLQFSVFPTYCFLHTVHVSKYKIFLLLQLKFLFSLNRVAPVEDLASSSFLRYPKEQRSQFDLLQGTTPNSSSGLNSALVSKRFRFGGCLVASRGLFFIDLILYIIYYIYYILYILLYIYYILYILSFANFVYILLKYTFHLFLNKFSSFVVLSSFFILSLSLYIYIRWCICQSLNSYHNNMILFWFFVCCWKILLCLPHSSSSVFSNNHSAMYLIIINLNSFFKATGITKSS